MVQKIMDGNETTKTFKGVKFMLHDSGSDSNEKIIIWSTLSDPIHLSHCVLWIIDCTFKVVPHYFSQMMIFQSKIREEFVILVYFLLSRKTKTSYCDVLTR